MLTKNTIRNKIRDLGIPRSTVSKLCKMHLPDLSAWLNNREEMNPVKIQRISDVVESIERAISLYPVKFDLRDPENVAVLLLAVKEAEARIAAEDFEGLRAATTKLLAGFNGFSSLSERPDRSLQFTK
jgi:hypothetical protein